MFLESPCMQTKKKMYKSLYFFVKWKGGQLLVLSTHLMSNASNVRIFYFTFTSASAYFIFKNWSIKWTAYIPDALLSKWEGIMQSTKHCSILATSALDLLCLYSTSLSLSLSPSLFPIDGLGYRTSTSPVQITLQREEEEAYWFFNSILRVIISQKLAQTRGAKLAPKAPSSINFDRPAN